MDTPETPEGIRLWFVVNTKPKSETRASHNLSSAGYELVNPKLKLRKYKEGKFVDVVEPLFPNYIFVKFHPVDDFHMVKYARGVKKIVTFGGKMVALQEELIDFIRNRLTDGMAQIQKKRFRKGERVLIKDGPFKGLSGVFERELEGEERAMILLEGINYYAKMVIDSDLISPS
jgi:transcriptional antiterminator RfaH